MLRNPKYSPPNLLSADQLFADGVLLPLHHLFPYSPKPEPKPEPSHHEAFPADQDPVPSEGLEPHLSAPEPQSSKRWRDIFQKTSRKASSSAPSGGTRDREIKEKKRERKSGGAATTAELNINLWPFSRSRSAGNNAVRRPRAASTSSSAAAAGPRKVSSAPCSRSNSAGESRFRKWPGSPARTGIHLGRSSPVWQARRGVSGGKSSDSAAAKGVKKEAFDRRLNKIQAPSAPDSGVGGAKGRVLNLNVQMCIGYRHHTNCRNDANGAGGTVGVGDGGGQIIGGSGSGDGGRGSNFFNLRGLFAKKVY